jgi:hypothetical protein
MVHSQKENGGTHHLQGSTGDDLRRSSAVEAAIACVKQWPYGPALLNGVPVPVILTAKVRFERARIS